LFFESDRRRVSFPRRCSFVVFSGRVPLLGRDLCPPYDVSHSLFVNPRLHLTFPSYIDLESRVARPSFRSSYYRCSNGSLLCPRWLSLPPSERPIFHPGGDLMPFIYSHIQLDGSPYSLSLLSIRFPDVPLFTLFPVTPSQNKNPNNSVLLFPPPPLFPHWWWVTLRLVLPYHTLDNHSCWGQPLPLSNTLVLSLFPPPLSTYFCQIPAPGVFSFWSSSRTVPCRDGRLLRYVSGKVRLSFPEGGGNAYTSLQRRLPPRWGLLADTALLVTSSP